MSRIRRAAVLVLSMMLVFTAVPASAQGGGPLPDFSELPGLQAAVSRAYSFDFSQAEMVPSDSAEADEQDYRDALVLGGMVLEFDSVDNATTGYDAVVAHGAEQVFAGFGVTAADITETDLEDLGDQAHAFSVFNKTDSTEGYIRYVVMQADTYVFISMIITEAEESSLDADALLAYFAEGTAKGHTGTGTQESEGVFSGGLWDFFPAADHELYEGLAPEEDEVFFPEPAA